MHDIPSEIKESVIKSLPMVNEITCSELRQKVIDAWALSLHLNGYNTIEEIPGSGLPGGPEKGTQADHVLVVAKLAQNMVGIIEDVYKESLNVNSDILLASALAHDVGKPFEYNPENQRRWNNDPKVSGRPALRHTLYGVYIALTVGLPEAVAHACGCHSPEGELVDRSLSNTVVHQADVAAWEILGSALGWNRE